MRKSASIALVILAACGGAQKPAGSSADTSSLEHDHEHDSESPSGDTAASSSAGSGGGATSPDDSTAKPSSSKPSSSGSGSGSGSSSAASAPAAAADAPAAAAFHPTPNALGSIDGKPFAPKIGRATAAMQKDGRLLVALTEGTECGASLKPGEGVLSLLLEWKDGYKTDVGSLKRATKPGGGEVGFSRGASVSKSFKPTGRVTVVKAPTDANATAKLKLDVQSGDLVLAGDIDVLLCVAAK
jgi:hypothetical protein